MSWDVSVQRFSRVYDSVEEIPDTETCLPIGNRNDLHAVVSKYFPGTDWSDPAWGVFDSQAGSIEFNFGRDGQSIGFMMHIRASAEVIPSIVEMCRTELWQALDCSTGEFLERSGAPDEGLTKWAEYRNRVVGDE